VSGFASESSVALLVGKSSSLLIVRVRKKVDEFIGSDVCTQGIIDGLEKVLEGDIGAIGCANVDGPWEVHRCEGKGWKGRGGSPFNEQSTRKWIVVLSNGGGIFYQIPKDLPRLQQRVWTKSLWVEWRFRLELGNIRNGVRRWSRKTMRRFWRSYWSCRGRNGRRKSKGRGSW